MCLLNYNKKNEKYKHFSYAERTMIETWYNKDGKAKKEIANLLHKSERTIRREINRGLVIVKDYLWCDKEEYSARVSQDKYDYNKTGKGPQMKLDCDQKLIDHIEKEILENKKTPEVIAFELNKNGFSISVSGKTIRNTIKKDGIFENINSEKSIENRPKEANERSVYGHWEGDLVVGKKGTKAVLFTLTERMTREEIIVKLENKKTETIAKALDKIERKYRNKFYSKFKTITFDNGVEFLGYKGLEKSCIRNTKRTAIYYAHPYCSGERGSNENNNRMIRRWIPKGTDITNIKKSFIKDVEDWLNNYPRKMFDYKSSNMILSNI